MRVDRADRPGHHGKEVVARVHPRDAKGPGETMRLALDMSKVVLFDPKTELRLE
ncbi:hypothetical protein JCM19000A_21360 [Silvimonas sp. JCM 19000]